MSFIAVIPARYASTRLPAKPLADISGRPMVVRVAERAERSSAAAVWVATDHEEVFAAVRAHGHQAMLTRADHATGTDRIAEVAGRLQCGDDQIIVNVQGDEPLVDPRLIDSVAACLDDAADASIATACHPIENAEDFFNPNVVKLVRDGQGNALYFSRAPIPFARDAFASRRDRLPGNLGAMRHIGLYAYRVSFLRRFAALAPSSLETSEALEQLRALWHGFRIRVVVSDVAPEAGVDTAEDLARVRMKFDDLIS